MEWLATPETWISALWQLKGPYLRAVGRKRTSCMTDRQSDSPWTMAGSRILHFMIKLAPVWEGVYQRAFPQQVRHVYMVSCNHKYSVDYLSGLIELCVTVWYSLLQERIGRKNRPHMHRHKPARLVMPSRVTLNGNAASDAQAYLSMLAETSLRHSQPSPLSIPTTNTPFGCRTKLTVRHPSAPGKRIAVPPPRVQPHSEYDI